MPASPPPFAHLHTHTEYSILDGACQVKPLVERVGELGMGAIGITDHGSMAGTVEMYRVAKKAGITPVLGLEAYVTDDHKVKTGDDGKRTQTTHLTLLARTEQGFRNLMQLSSKGCLEGYYYKPRIDHGLMAQHAEGVIALTGCMASKTQRLLADGNQAGAHGEVDALANIFGHDNVYVEFQDAGIPEQKQLNAGLRRIQQEMGLGAVITSDVHYLRHEDAVPHDALLCIQTKAKIADVDRFRFSTDQFFLKSPEQMYEQFLALGYPEEWLRASVEIAERCEFDLELDKTLLPDFPWTDGLDLDDYLRARCEQGLRERYPTVDGELESRLTFELETIKKMGYSAYFLITWDWIKWSKDNGIAIGPGRGSAAGSLVAYTLGITAVDPMKYDLLFERFLNPDRISMPDIDTDVSVVGRERVIAYLAERYGRDRVAQIATFGRMAPKAAVKDAARVMDYPVAVGDRISKLIPDGPGQSFAKNMASGAELRKAYDTDETVKAVVDMAMPLEGVVRNAGIHAAAVVIGARPLMESAPLRGGDHGGQVVTQVAQSDAEALGLLKMDVLGLRNLDVLEKVVQFIEQSKGVTVDVANLPLDDAPTFEMIARGDCMGVFQLESEGMQGAARQVRPTVFEDIVALVALYRPGPMEYIPTYARNKHDRSLIAYGDPRLEQVLSETNGITIYQEQYMRIARLLAGFTPGEADNLRKGIAKKLRAVLDQIKPKFLAGCKENGVPDKTAAQLWDDAEKAGDYSFNKSHAVCYALIAYQTAYLKAHHPAEYMAALISTVMNTKDKVPYFVNGCKKMGLSVLPPDVNQSFSDFTVVGKDIRFGLTAVKGVGAQAVATVVAAREDGGRFTSIYDFCERVDKNQANKRVLEALVKAGAFDSTGDSRKGMLDALPQAMAMGTKAQADVASGQFDLFGMALDGGSDGGAVESAMDRSYPPIPPGEFTSIEKLEAELEATGLYMSGHPFDDWADAVDERIEQRLSALADLPGGAEVRIGGMVKGLRQLVTKKGDLMAFCELEDRDSTARVVVFSRTFETARSALTAPNAVVVVRGKLEQKEGSTDVIAESVMTLDEAPKLTTMTVQAMARDFTDAKVRELVRILSNYPGEANVDFQVSLPGSAHRLRAGSKWRVKIEPGLKHEIREVLGPKAVV